MPRQDKRARGAEIRKAKRARASAIQQARIAKMTPIGRIFGIVWRFGIAIIALYLAIVVFASLFH